MISSISFCDACQAFDSRASLTARLTSRRFAARFDARPVALLILPIIYERTREGPHHHYDHLPILAAVASTNFAKCLSTQACCHRASPNTALFNNGFVFASSANIARAVVSANRTTPQPLGALPPAVIVGSRQARPSAATKAPLTDPSASPFVSWTHRQHARAPSNPSDSLPGRRISSTNAAVAKCRAAAAPLAFLLDRPRPSVVISQP